MSTADIVRSLSNAEVVQVAEALFDIVYTEVSHDAVLESSAQTPEVTALASLTPDVLQRELSAEDSTRLARNMLVAYAEDPQLAPVVQRAIDDVHKSDKLLVPALLTLGLIVNLTLVVVSTSIEMEKDKDGKVTWKVKKRETQPKTIKAVIEPLIKLLKLGTKPGS